MSIIDEIRGERVDLARVLKKHKGIRRIVEDLYPDSAHFIYELLQNAEDTGATETTFRLEENGLFFEHNGRPFEPPDIYAITDIGEGTKAADNDKIGRFGVGFKAVFAYSETPRIWSPTFSFEITELVLPAALETNSGVGDKTCFEFPFNNPKKAPQNAYEEIKEGLEELAETALLFLSDLESIRWQVRGKPAGEVLRIEHSLNHIEVLKQVDGKKTRASHFLRFCNPVDGLEKQNVTIAFELDFLPNITEFEAKKPLFMQLKIVQANPGRVAVFFPAEKEVSGLRFHLHAPFVPELSRASVKETPANEPLFFQLAALAAASLHSIRDLEMLTGDFLGVLPNQQDVLPKRYQPIREAIITEMINEPVTPTYSKTHSQAKHLVQAKLSLKSLLSEQDLEFLIDYGAVPPQWAITASQKNSFQDRFISALAITEWNIEQFVDLLEDRAYGEEWAEVDENFMDWIRKKPMEWHQHFYAMLYREQEAGEDFLDRLNDVKIVRLTDGSYGVGYKSYFVTDGMVPDEIFPCVDPEVYSSGKSKTQQSNSKKFLKSIGVREIGEVEKIESILDQRYSTENCFIQEKTYFTDLKRFIELVEKEPNRADLFTNKYIFRQKNHKWCQPRKLYLDKPFKNTGLSSYYKVIGEKGLRSALANSYQDSGIDIERIGRFAQAVRVQHKLLIFQQSTNKHTSKDVLRQDYYQPYVRWTSTAIDNDWMIQYLEELLVDPSENLSRLLWKTMVNAIPNILKAQFRPNQQYRIREQPSSLVLILRRMRWVPQGNEEFVTPENAYREKLPKGFPYDEDYEWLKALGFGAKIRQQTEEHIKKRAVAKDVLGTDDPDSIEDAKWFVGLSEEERQSFKAEYHSRNVSDLPEHEPQHPERRAKRLGEQAAGAPERTKEQRTRTVSIGQGEIKKEADQYLRQQYTDDNDRTICQVCKKELPFKLHDDSYYFEKVELLPELKKRYPQNYIALCPNHAAMFQHANGSIETIKTSLFESNNNHVDITLANKNASIYFTKTHIADLQTVIHSDTEDSKIGV